MRGLVLVLALSGCSVIGWVEDGAKKAGGEIGGTIAEYTVCPADISSLIECGHVYECRGTANPDPHSWGYVEICIDDDDHPEQLDDIEALYGECAPTPRHQGLCSYCCGPDCGKGANAFNGCYCP